MNCKECSKNIPWYRGKVTQADGTVYHRKCYDNIVKEITGGDKSGK